MASKNISNRESRMVLQYFRKNGTVKYTYNGGYYCTVCERFMNEDESIKKHLFIREPHRKEYMQVYQQIKEEEFSYLDTTEPIQN